MLTRCAFVYFENRRRNRSRKLSRSYDLDRRSATNFKLNTARVHFHFSWFGLLAKTRHNFPA
jgi:hypothetical protein